MTRRKKQAAEPGTDRCSRRHAVASLAMVPLASVLGCGGDDDAPVTGTPAEDASPPPAPPNEASVQRFVKAYNAHDLEGVLAFFSNDATVSVNTTTLADRDALRAFFIEYGATDGPTPYASAYMVRQNTYPGDDLIIFMGQVSGTRAGNVSGFPPRVSLVPIACSFLCEFGPDGRCATCRIFLNWGALLPEPV
jgi:hypothetical protein